MKVIITIALVAYLSGCGSTALYKETSKTYGAAVDAATEKLKPNPQELKKIERLELVFQGINQKTQGNEARYYQGLWNKLDEAKSIPFDDSDAFAAVFICAGSEGFQGIEVPLNMLSTHAKVINSVASESPDSISELIASIRKYSEDDEVQVISTDFDASTKIAEQQQVKCHQQALELIVELKSILYPAVEKGIYESSGTDLLLELAPDVSSISPKIKALKALLFSVLTPIEDAVRKKYLDDFVKDNSKKVDLAITGLQESSSLLVNLNRRKKIADFALPYAQLRSLGAFDKAPADLISLAIELDKQLGETVKIVATVNYDGLLENIRKAHADLARIASGELTKEEYKSAYVNIKNYTDAIKAALEAL